MIRQFPDIDLRRFQLKLIFLSTGKAGQMSDIPASTLAGAVRRVTKSKRKVKKRKVVKVVKTAKRAIVKRAKASTASAVEKPFLTAIHRKEREIRKIRDMMGKAKDLAG